MKNDRTVIIQCSARIDGDSASITNWLSQKFNADSIALCELTIHPFDYKNRFESDDFISTIQKLIDSYQHIIFVTPVYWYTMSARMKIFLDRISDLLKWHKETGRQLRGMSMGLFSVSNDPELQDHFDVPIRLSAGYLGMPYLGHTHCWVESGAIPDEVQKKIEEYMNSIPRDAS